MNLRCSFVIASLAVCCFATAQQGSVTYETVAVPVKRALKDLSDKSGVRLESAPIMDREVLILRLNDAPLAEVMKQIARVTSGEWTEKDGTYYLSPDKSGRIKEETQSQKQFADSVAKSLKQMQARMEPRKNKSTEEAAEPDEMPDPRFMAGYTALSKIAIAIGASNLSSVPRDGRVVFSTSPTAMQRRMPVNIAGYIDDYVKGYNARVAAQKNEEPIQDLPEGADVFLKMFNPKLTVITSAPSKALIIAQRGGMMGYSLELRLYDTTGKMIARDNLPFAIESPFAALMEGDSEDPDQKPEPDTSPQIKFSPLTQELSSIAPGIRAMQAGQMKISDDLKARLQDPINYDPLSYTYSEALLQIAKTRNEQLVADLPDGVSSFFAGMFRKSGTTQKAFLKSLAPSIALTEENGWMTVKPLDPIASRAERTDRVALKRLIDAVETLGYLSLDDLAAYAQSNEDPMTGAPASTLYIMMFAPGAMQAGMMGQVDWNLLRFYGTLSATQKASLQKGAPMTFGSLQPNQKALVTTMLFGPETDLSITDNAKKQDEDPFTSMIMKQISRFGPGSSGGDYRTEPTEIMPNGLPSSGYIQVSFSSEPVGVPTGSSSSLGEFSTLGPMELGLLKMFKEDPKMSEMSGGLPTIEGLKVGTRSKYMFNFFVAPDIAQSGNLQDDRIPKDATTYKMNNLPASFQADIDRMAAAMKKNPFWSAIGSMGMGRQQQLPPP